jgi:hypothetical protein
MRGKAMMKTAKELLLSGEPLPPGTSPEELPAAMEAPEDDCGHGNGHIPREFLRMTPLDCAGRRALWMRFPPFTGNEAIYESNGSCVELRAGREGDDAHLLLTEGDVLTKNTIRQLVDLLLTMKWGMDQ